jgi:predicted phosphodiesterase
MKLLIASDLHIECGGPPFVVEPDPEAVLILAGDIGTATRSDQIVGLFNSTAPGFRHVLYVIGNHEFYGMRFGETLPHLHAALSHLPNVTVAGHKLQTVVIDGVRFLLTTLWTDYTGDRELIARSINDHRLIFDDAGWGMTPEALAMLHCDVVDDLDADMRPGDVVVTHHLPSMACVAPEYADSLINGAFACNDLDALILERKPALWICGHTHSPVAVTIGQTPVIANPRGYPGERPGQYRAVSAYVEAPRRNIAQEMLDGIRDYKAGKCEVVNVPIEKVRAYAQGKRP